VTLDLEALNDELAQHDLVIMQQSNLRYAIFRIERGAIAAHGTHYDRYVRARRESFATLAQALTAAEAMR
jgi:hypothetical protein